MNRALWTQPAAARSRSASASTIIASLPPSSRLHGTSRSCRAHRDLATGGDRAGEVDVVHGVHQCRARAPSPVATSRTSGGPPASSHIRAASDTPSGVSSEGLQTTVLPASSAGMASPTVSVSGTFHGPMTPTTPTGSCWMVLRRPIANTPPPFDLLVGEPVGGAARELVRPGHGQHHVGVAVLPRLGRLGLQGLDEQVAVLGAVGDGTGRTIAARSATLRCGPVAAALPGPGRPAASTPAHPARGPRRPPRRWPGWCTARGLQSGSSRGRVRVVMVAPGRGGLHGQRPHRCGPSGAGRAAVARETTLVLVSHSLHDRGGRVRVDGRRRAHRARRRCARGRRGRSLGPPGAGRGPRGLRRPGRAGDDDGGRRTTGCARPGDRLPQVRHQGRAGRGRAAG